jgi:hypothetical protein
MKKLLYPLLFCLILALSACTQSTPTVEQNKITIPPPANNETDVINNDQKPNSEAQVEDESNTKKDVLKDQPVAGLKDVTEGKDVRGINTGGNARGSISACFKEETFTMNAQFEGLPDPLGTDFYEGWVVRKSPLSVISTGKAEKIGERFTNPFESETDYTDHPLYVLTLEPDDGDPAPADHIIEGTLIYN